MAFQPTSPLLARAVRYLKLTTKMTNKGYYKGTRAGGIGHWSWNRRRWNVYKINYEKVRTYNAPAKKVMEDFKLEPFVAERIRAPAAADKKLTGKSFLEDVKSDGSEISYA